MLALLAAALALLPAAAPADLHGDPLPAGALARLGTIRLRHPAESLAFSADGKVLASAAADGSVVLWDPVTGKELRRLPVGIHATTAVTFSPGGRYLVRTGHGQVHLFDPATWKKVREFEGAFWGFSPDGKLLAVGGTGGTPKQFVTVWEADSGKQVCRLEHAGDVRAAVFSPDGKRLATVFRAWQERDSGRTLQIWDIQGGKRLHQLPGQSSQSGFCWLAFSPDGKVLTLADGSRPARFWDAATGKEMPGLKKEEGRRLEPRFVIFTLDGKLLVTEDSAGGMRVYDRATSKLVRPLAGFLPSVLGAGTVLAVQDRPGLLRLHKLSTLEVLGEFRSQHESLSCCALTSDGKTLAAVERSRIRLWDVATGRERSLPDGPGYQLAALACSPDGKSVAGVARFEPTIRIWEAATGKLLRKLDASTDRVSHLAFSPDGASLAMAEGRIVRIVQISTGKLLHRIEGHAGAVTCLAFSPDGNTLATGSANPHAGARMVVLAGATQVCLWSTATGKRVGSLERHGPGFAHVAFRNGRWLAFEGGIEKVAVVDVGSGRVLYELPGQFAALSPDGRTLAVVRRKPAVQLLEMATGKEWAVLPREDGWDLAYAFSPDGRFLTSGKGDGSVQVWSVATGKVCKKIAGHTGMVACLAFTGDNRALVTGSGDTTALVWDWREVARSEGLAARELSAEDRDRLWTDLANEDGRKAHEAVWSLVAAGDKGVALLRERLKPATGDDVKRVRQLIADLDDNRFAVRENASKKLTELGDEAEAALRQALESNPSAEVRRRIEALLRAPRFVRSPGLLRGLRAVQALEQIGSKEARGLLRAYAAGAPAALLTQDARAALERLDRRGAKP